MKQISGAALLLILAANPAFALKVTNLDSVAHTVELSGRGEPQQRVIQPNATEFFAGASQGFLSVVEAVPAAQKGAKKAPKTAVPDSVVHADGLLSGVIGNARSTGIPADPDNSYVIWPEGRLMLQSRVKNSRNR